MEVDTIVSLSTAPGSGAIAVVRMSGPAATEVLGRLTGGRLPEVRRATLLRLLDPADGAVLDRALVTRYVAPESFTGEDLVELSCHGGWLVPSLVVDACERLGARRAEPGEFTRRAYLLGKLDLVQAEAIADLVEGRSRALHRAAVAQLERGLSRRVADLRAGLVHLEALLAHHVDFPEEDDAPVPVERIIAEAVRLRGEMEAMVATAPEGELLREGALVVFAGRPNAGKSSLYNALIGEERAIVTDVPGTTRDALEASVQLGGYPFRLVDTAGLRSSDDRIERLGIEVARRYLAAADLVLLCVPADEEMTDADRGFVEEWAKAPVVVVCTKADLQEEAAHEGGGAGGSRGGQTGATPSDGHERREGVAGRVRVSVRSGEGLAELRSLLPGLVYSAVIGAGDEVPVLTRQRQAAALKAALGEVEAFERGLDDGLPAELAGTHLRSAETALEELIGLVSADDVLDVVFGEFCIGK